MTGRRTHSPAHTRTVKCTRARPMSPAAPLLKTKVWAICGLAAAREREGTGRRTHPHTHPHSERVVSRSKHELAPGLMLDPQDRQD